MKRTIFLSVLALTISAGITAQEPEQTQSQDRSQVQTQVRDQERVETGQGIMAQNQTRTKISKQEKQMLKAQKKADKSNHGQTVSQTARSTPSGQGKGEVVSTQAKIQGESRQADIKTRTSAKNQSSARGNVPQSGKASPAGKGGPRGR